VNLAETEQVHDLLGLGGQLVDTSGPDDKGDLGLGLDKEVSGGLGITLVLDEFAVSFSILLDVLFSVASSGLA